MASVVTSDQIVEEVQQYQFLDELYKYFRDDVREPGASAKKIPTTYGRWLQNVQYFDVCEEDEVRYRLLPRKLMENNSCSRVELKKMLREDLKLDENVSEAVTKELCSKVQEFLDKKHSDEALPDIAVRYTENGLGGQISVSDFRTRFCPRVRFLAQNFGAEQTALMCLRYSQLSKFRGGESGMCVSGLNALHEVGMVTFEGFSSPLNCRLLGREGVKFCSLFEDTDASFGSLGNFFRIDLSDHPGGWSLGPPFVEPVLNATADRVLNALEETEPGQLWFFVTFPNWDDNPGWKMLNQSSRKVDKIDFDKREFWQQDDYGKSCQQNSKVCIFVLGNLPDEECLMELRNRFSACHKDKVEDDWIKVCSEMHSGYAKPKK